MEEDGVRLRTFEEFVSWWNELGRADPEGQQTKRRKYESGFSATLEADRKDVAALVEHVTVLPGASPKVSS